MRGYAASGLPDEIWKAGGEIFAITSKSQTLASRAEAEWESGFHAVGDPPQEISGHCGERGRLELFGHENPEFLQGSVEWALQHPKGYFQPGVLALTSAGRVLYRWRCAPSRKKMGGAQERPNPEHVGFDLSRRLEAPAGTPDPDLDEQPVLDARAVRWPFFVSILIANGWSIGPRALTQERASVEPHLGILGVLLTVVAIRAAWGAAFATLLTLWVGAALAGWIAWIAPRIRWLSAQFQDEVERPGRGPLGDLPG